MAMPSTFQENVKSTDLGSGYFEAPSNEMMTLDACKLYTHAISEMCHFLLSSLLLPTTNSCHRRFHTSLGCRLLDFLDRAAVAPMEPFSAFLRNGSTERWNPAIG